LTTNQPCLNRRYDPSIDAYYVTFLAGRTLSWNGQDKNDIIPKGSKIPVLAGDGTLANGATFSYDVANARWISRNFFVPEIYSHIDNAMYTCRFVENVSDPPLENGQDFWLFKHSIEYPRARYYFTNSGIQLSCVTNQNPSLSKTFDAVSIEGDGKLNGASSFTMTNQGTLSSVSPTFSRKEGVWYTRTGRDISSNSTSSLKGIGVAAEVSGNRLILSNNVSYLSIANYNAVYYLDNGILTSITGDPNTLGLVIGVDNPSTVYLNNSPTPAAVGNLIVIQSDASINGDHVRGQWCEVVVSQSATQSPITIYAINTHFTPSLYGHGANE
jgi:hypothetical protein